MGLIWTVHVVHYPLFAAVKTGFRAYHEAHMQRITLVVGPLMLAELLTAFMLWADPPKDELGAPLAGLVLLGIVWLETDSSRCRSTAGWRPASIPRPTAHHGGQPGAHPGVDGAGRAGYLGPLRVLRGAAEPRRGEVDAVVVGAGFGGIGAALRLAEGGARVLLAERTTYPGCACTFEFEGDHFEGGATLFSGFDDEQLFGRWIDRHGIDVSSSASIRARRGPVGRGPGQP